MDSSNSTSSDSGTPGGRRSGAGDAVDPGGRGVPVGHQGFKGISLARECLHLLVVRALDVPEAVKDVGGLPQCEPKVAPIQRDVAEADGRTAGVLLRREPRVVGLKARQRHAALHPPLHVDKGNLGD